MASRYKAEVTELPEVPHDLSTFIKDGIRNVYLYDYDGVVSPYLMNRTFPKEYYTPNKFRRVPNPLYTEENKLKPFYEREVKSFDDCYSTELIEDLSPLHTDPTSLLVMVTTWRNNAPINEFSFDTVNPVYYLPWGHSREDMDHHNKVAAVARFISSPWGDAPVKMTWIDDVVLSDSDKVRRGGDPVNVTDYMFRNFNNPVEDVKLVAPSSNFGLSRAEVDEVKKFMLSN